MWPRECNTIKKLECFLLWKIDDSCLAASVAQTPTMQKIPFNWHLSSSDEYIRQVTAREDVKNFDFIHMIQVRSRICH